ncbi:hypothetical protein BJ322DRAFT_1054187 [Thelephora terrestris]|uniref:Uncharacterized protein n=1 Tax=Thelephora terrestris TaxID=56493 RepID=A0A9P6L8J1_9AGAM|nr:hypothetical protein BJ322DRAFT_1054187 [Thelephora terrestris]
MIFSWISAKVVVSFPIAPSTGWSSSSNCLPFNTWPRASQTSAQESPSSIQSFLFAIESLIIVRMIAAEAKAALAGVMLTISFARFMPSIVILSAERAPSRPFDCFGSVAIFQTRGGREKRVQHSGCARKWKARVVTDASGNFVTIQLVRTLYPCDE